MKKLMIILAGLVLTFGINNVVFADNGKGNNGNGNGNGGSNGSGGSDSSPGTVVGNDTETVSHNIGLTIETLALVDIETEGNNIIISLNPTAPTEAGLGYDFTGAVNNKLWLNYSSIVENNNSRKITAEANDNFPEGIALTVTAANAHPSGKGTLGTGTGNSEVTLEGEAKTIVTGIGSCYTGDGEGRGCNLTYKLLMNNDNYAGLLALEYSATVTYTIVEN